MSAIGKRNNLAEEEEVVNGEMEEVGLEDVDGEDAKEIMTLDNYIKKWSTVYQFDVQKVYGYIENNIKDQPGLCLSTWMLLDVGVRLYFEKKEHSICSAKCGHYTYSTCVLIQ